jgi:transposase
MTHPVKLRQEIVVAVDAGAPQAEAARTFGVSIASVERYVRQWRAVGHVDPRPRPPRGKAIGPADLPALAAQLAAHPHLPVPEQCTLWEQSHGRRLHRVTMGRAIRELGWTKRWSH